MGGFFGFCADRSSIRCFIGLAKYLATQLFGATPPVPNKEWPSADGDEVVAYKEFSEELLTEKLRWYFH